MKPPFIIITPPHVTLFASILSTKSRDSPSTNRQKQRLAQDVTHLRVRSLRSIWASMTTSLVRRICSRSSNLTSVLLTSLISSPRRWLIGRFDTCSLNENLIACSLTWLLPKTCSSRQRILIKRRRRRRKKKSRLVPYAWRTCWRMKRWNCCFLVRIGFILDVLLCGYRTVTLALSAVKICGSSVFFE